LDNNQRALGALPNYNILSDSGQKFLGDFLFAAIRDRECLNREIALNDGEKSIRFVPHRSEWFR